ncbi:MAG TPA: glycosyltransferase family 39 protein [Candidatus Saccharimonadales bacterium]|nr:glycosyltransferase family 39 protein [Candidatus Saccharimonadales bacterium]
MSEVPDLSIVIPAYNEGAQFDDRMKLLADWLHKHDYGQVEILIMMQNDDTSGDVEEAQAFTKHHPGFRVINLGQRAGKGGAVKAGMMAAGGRYRLFMDADLATPLKHLDDVKALMDRGAKVGIAIRNLVSTHKGLMRKLITRSGNIMAQIILLPGIKDTQCGFKVFEANAAEQIFSRQTLSGWGFDLEILAIARMLGYTIETFPANDWKDPKAAGLVGDSPIKAAIQVFLDLINVRWGLMTGRYKRPQTSLTHASVQERLAETYDRLVLAGAILVGALLRFINISKASIWHDEGYTMMLAPQSPAQIIARTARDVHPPLYYLSLHYWIRIFGVSELGARSLSAILMLAAIIVGFLLARELFGHRVARLSAVFLALGPFLIRYGQEARMYAMAAFLAVLATYLLVRAQRTNRWWFWASYSLAIAAGLYTHYYFIFIIILHWLYMIAVRQPRWGIKRVGWWLANWGSAMLFLPWLPKAYDQFSRVQAAFWIPKANYLTLPSTMAQFLTFTDLGRIAAILRFSGFVLLMVASIILALKRKYFPSGALIAGLTFLGPLAVLIVSLGKRPIYVDRYFVFAAVGFYILLAAILYLVAPFERSRMARWAAIFVLLVTFGIGTHNVYAQATHAMGQVGDYVDANYSPGDAIVSGELYTYFDFSYYNHTGSTTLLLAPGGVTGYGETSLLYDRADKIVVASFNQVHPASGYVWVVGKPGHNDDFAVPASWRLLDDFQAADSEVRHYHTSGS